MTDDKREKQRVIVCQMIVRYISIPTYKNIL